MKKLIIFCLIGFFVIVNVIAIPKLMSQDNELDRLFNYCKNQVSSDWANSCAELEYTGDSVESEACIRKCASRKYVRAEDGSYVLKSYYD